MTKKYAKTYKVSDPKFTKLNLGNLKAVKKSGTGNDPTVEARVVYGDGGGVMIDFKITKQGSVGAVKLSAYVKGCTVNEALPNATPNAGYAAGTVVLDPNAIVQYQTLFQRIGLLQTYVWVYVDVELENGAINQHVRRWQLVPAPAFAYAGMPKL